MGRRIPGVMGIAGYAALVLFALGSVCAAIGAELPSVALADFSYKDTSGEVRDQTSEHRARLDMINRLLRENLASSGKFTVVHIECKSADCTVEDGIASAALAQSAADAGARYLVVGGVQKMSTLVQWARVGVVDIKERKSVLDRLYSFRGDTDEAWRQAALFAARDVNQLRLGD